MQNNLSPQQLTSSFFLPFFGMFLFFTGCHSVDSFYLKPRPASYYTDRYCFEVSREQALAALEDFLQKQQFPLLQSDKANGRYQTKPIQMTRFGRNPEKGYVIGLEIALIASQGKLDLRGIPDWAISEQRAPKMPPPPQRQDFPTEEAHANALQQYQEQLEKLGEAMEKGVALAKEWQGCRLRESTQRALFTLRAEIRAYPLKPPFYTLDLQQKPIRILSDKTFEYSILREIGKRLQKRRFMPPLLR
jgi:hypothetical protein